MRKKSCNEYFTFFKNLINVKFLFTPIIHGTLLTGGKKNRLERNVYKNKKELNVENNESGSRSCR